MKAWRVLPFLLAAAMAPGALQDGQSRQPGVIIGIGQEPGEVVPVGGLAKFEGAVADGADLADHRIRVKVTSPDGQVRTHTLAYANDGTFIYHIGNLQEGIYRVDFVGLDGRNTVQRSFRVENAARVAEVLAKKKSLLEAARRLAERAAERVERAPEGPNREEARTRTRRIREDHRSLQQSVERVFDAAQNLSQLQAAPQEVSGPAMEALSDISAWAASTDQDEAEMRAFEERTRSMPSTCDSLETAAEGLRFVGSLSSLILKPMDTLKKLAQDKLKDEVVERARAAIGSRPPQPGQPGASTTTQDIKFVIDRFKAEVEAFHSGGKDGMLRTIPSQARETSVFIIDHLFTHYCSVIEGPARAEFSVYHPENGKLFYRYKVILEAKLRLWTEKSQPATPQGVPYSGRLEGSVTKVEFEADVFNVEKPPKGTKVVAVKTLPAPVLRKSNQNVVGSGQIMRTLTPGHFNARYSGLLNETGMKIKQEEVTDDFSPLFANRVAVIAILPGGLVPGITTFTFPIQKGCWIYDRGTKGAFEAPLSRVGENLVFKKEFTRNETVGSGIKVDWKLSYDLKGSRPPLGSGG